MLTANKHLAHAQKYAKRQRLLEQKKKKKTNTTSIWCSNILILRKTNLKSIGNTRNPYSYPNLPFMIWYWTQLKLAGNILWPGLQAHAAVLVSWLSSHTSLCNMLVCLMLWPLEKRISTLWLCLWLLSGFGSTLTWLCGAPLSSLWLTIGNSQFCLWLFILLASCCVIWRNWRTCVQWQPFSKQSARTRDWGWLRLSLGPFSRSLVWWASPGSCTSVWKGLFHSLMSRFNTKCPCCSSIF